MTTWSKHRVTPMHFREVLEVGIQAWENSATEMALSGGTADALEVSIHYGNRDASLTVRSDAS